MFAKLARFQSLGRRHSTSSRATHSNDNRPTRQLTVVAQPARRRALVCAWRQVPATGRLECSWSLEAAACDEQLAKVARADASPPSLRVAWAIIDRRYHKFAIASCDTSLSAGRRQRVRDGT
jgi:hypothetical protein